jgi:hypothetical protein
MNKMNVDDKYFNTIQNEKNDIVYLKKCIAEKDEEIKELKLQLKNKHKILI